MIAALLLATAPAAMTPLDAEHAFSADARTIGQWTAFRKWAAPDAIFLPPVPVAEALKDSKDPPKSVEWWPTASFLSCDGQTAVNTGGALWPGGRHSFFTTVWVRQADGNWRYALDHGNDLATPRARPTQDPVIRKASCNGRPAELPPALYPPGQAGGGASRDRTLQWVWYIGDDKSRELLVWLWTGDTLEQVIADRLPATPRPAPK